MAAQVFSVMTPALDEADEMTGEEADQRMLDSVNVLLPPEKGVAAIASVLGQFLPLGYSVHAMPEQVAQIADFFAERLLLRVWITRGFKQERMPAGETDIFVMAIARSRFDIMMAEQETRDGVADAGFRAMLIKERLSAAATLGASPHPLEGHVIHLMAKQSAERFQIKLPPGRWNLGQAQFGGKRRQLAHHGFPFAAGGEGGPSRTSS
jgi:hypothetical protein